MSTAIANATYRSSFPRDRRVPIPHGSEGGSPLFQKRAHAFPLINGLKARGKQIRFSREAHTRFAGKRQAHCSLGRSIRNRAIRRNTLRQFARLWKKPLGFIDGVDNANA
jgi:hypothetical protein